METTTRNADLKTIVSMLREQHARKHDVVVPAAQLRTEVLDDAARFVIPDVEITLDGVTNVDVPYEIGGYAAGQIAQRTGIPTQYLRRMLDVAPDLATENMNHWFGADNKDALLRTFRPADGEGGIGFLRTLLSSKFALMDNLDVLMATLEGIRATGIHVEVRSADLTERNMHVRFFSPELALPIEDLVKSYEVPGRSGKDYPMLYAGLTLANSEVGAGSFNLNGQVVVQVCTNGLTMTKDAFKKVHLGERLEEGTVNWSEDTNRKQLELITSKTRDVVKTIMSPDYLRMAVDQLREKANIAVTKPVEVIREVSKQMKYTDEQQEAILNAFITGKDFTALGVGQATTFLAQSATDGDAQSDAENDVWKVMEFAAKAAVTV